MMPAFVYVARKSVFSAPSMGLALVALLTACGQHGVGASKVKAGWNQDNNPANLADRYQTNFGSLPTSAELDHKPWSDSYWPSFQGGIANRWNDNSRQSAFSYWLADEGTVRSMRYDDLKKLSPAEKYDILEGRFDYPTVKSERERTHANDPTWYGLCHGLGPASITYNEPKNVDLRSANGILVPFGSSDVKALLIYMHAQEDGGGRYAGLRCNHDLSKEPWHANDPECRGVNAGSFHVILANQIGLQQKAFVAEVRRSAQIWNHPVYSYDSSVQWRSNNVYRGAAPGTREIVGVHTRMRYIGATWMSWYPQPFYQNPKQENDVDYDYILELNGSGNIIGGEWKTEDRPAFLWEQQEPSYNGYMADVKRVYDASQY